MHYGVYGGAIRLVDGMWEIKRSGSSLRLSDPDVKITRALLRGYPLPTWVAGRKTPRDLTLRPNMAAVVALAVTSRQSCHVWNTPYSGYFDGPVTLNDRPHKFSRLISTTPSQNPRNQSGQKALANP